MLPRFRPQSNRCIQRIQAHKAKADDCAPGNTILRRNKNKKKKWSYLGAAGDSNAVDAGNVMLLIKRECTET